MRYNVIENFSNKTKVSRTDGVEGQCMGVNPLRGLNSQRTKFYIFELRVGHIKALQTTRCKICSKSLMKAEIELCLYHCQIIIFRNLRMKAQKVKFATIKRMTGCKTEHELSTLQCANRA